MGIGRYPSPQVLRSRPHCDVCGWTEVSLSPEITLAIAAVMSLGGLVGCSSKGDSEQEFSFSLRVEGNYETLEVRSEPYHLVIDDNGVDADDRTYSYVSSDEEVAEITNRGYIFTKSEGTVRFTVTEEKSQLEVSKVYDVIGGSILATGGYNFSAAATAEQRETRTEILGKLEKYAMDTHLTGISLFENGGYMLYSERALALLGNRQYITGYGYGLLSDSDAPFTDPLPSLIQERQIIMPKYPVAIKG